MSEATFLMEEHDERFHIENDQQALWAAKKLNEIRHEVATWEAFYKEQLEKIKRENEGREQYFTGILREYFESRPHKVTKTQESYSLPGVKLVLKTKAPEYKREPEKVIEWLKSNGGGFIKTKTTESLDWDGFKTVLLAEGGIARLNGTQFVVAETGEVIPGITVLPAVDDFQIKVEG